MSVLFQTVVNTRRLYSYRNLKKSVSLCGCSFIRKASDGPRKFVTFDEVAEARRAEARRSLVVQVNSEASFGELHSYCSKYADIQGIHHYKNFGGEHFMLIEFKTEENLKDVLHSCSSHQKEIDTMPVQSPFLWFRAAGSKKEKNIVPCSATLVTKDGSALPSEDKLFEELMVAQTVSDQIQLLHDRTILNDLGVRLRYLVARELEVILENLYNNVEVRPFGSSVNGFGRMGCDLDLVLSHTVPKEMTDPSRRLVFHDKRCEPRPQRQLELLAEVIDLRAPGAGRVQRILHARVPIVKFAHELAAVDCDLCYSNMSGVYMSELLHVLGCLDARARPLALAVRRWAAAAALTAAAPGRWITNFPLTLLVLFFLQQGPKPVLPTIKHLVKHAGEYELLIELALAVRRWAAAAALTAAAPGRWITNFPLTLLVLFFLQQGPKPVLPTIKHLVKHAGEYELLIELALAVRRWAAAAALTAAAPGRWITNFPLTLLVLFFLQQGPKPVLPTIKHLVKHAGEYELLIELALAVRRWAAAAALTAAAPGRWITNFPLTLLVLFFLQQGPKPVLPTIKHLVKHAGEYELLIELALAVRRWAAAAALTAAAPGRWITNFPLTLLVLFFLQQGPKPVLPTIKHLVKHAGEYELLIELALAVRRWAAAAALTAAAPGRWITNFPLTLLVLFFLQQGPKPVLPTIKHLVKHAGEYELLIELALAVRRWAAAAALTAAAPGRWITNFPLTLLVLFFLQQGPKPVLPTIKHLVKHAGEYELLIELALAVRRWAAAAALTAAAPGRWITNFPLTLLVLFFLQQGPKPVLPTIKHLVKHAGEYELLIELALAVRRWAAAAALTAAAPGRWITNFPLTLLVLFFLQQGPKPVLPTIKHLVKHAGEYELLIELALAVRRWAAAAALTAAAPGRWITNFPLTLLVLFFLQQGPKPVLPTIKHLVKHAGEYELLIELALAVRRWAAAAALTAAAPGRWITNFPLTLLVLFFLQQGPKPVLPTIKHLVKHAGEYELLIELALAVRRWAAAAALTAAAPGRWITNFPLTLLVLFFLQQGPKPVLPTIKHLVKHAGEYELLIELALAVRRWAAAAALTAAAPGRWITNFPLTLLVLFFLQQGPKPVLPTIKHLVKHAGEYELLIELALAVRRWAAAAALTAAAPGRWITNFPLTLLVLFFLQQGPKPVLPTIKHLVKHAGKEDIRIAEDNKNCTFCRDSNKLPPSSYAQSDASLENLLLQFFEFYAQFDFQERAISLNEGSAIRKPNSLPLYIVNPLEPALNVSRNVSYEECERLKMEVRNAAWQLEAEMEGAKKDDWGLLGLIEKKTTRGLKKLLRVGNSQRLVSVKDLFTDDDQPTDNKLKNKLDKLSKISDVKEQSDKKVKEVKVTAAGDTKETVKFKNSQVASEVYRIRRDKIV